MKIESINTTTFSWMSPRVSDSAGHSHPGDPHSAFGTPGYLRIAYAVEDNLLHSACQRLLAACESLSV